jgi:glycosyltransferase involved in cell wall biosynthesis
MNLLLINPIHPATPHISAMRAWRFSQALAAMGHRVVLLTATPAGVEEGQIPSTHGHDWRAPLVLAVAAFDTTSTAGGRNPLFRRLATAWQLLRRGGHQKVWVEAALGAARRLSSEFRPDAIWTTFGRMEAVFLAREIAQAQRIPWVLDLKDNWELFVPRLLRRLMARRISGWSALTTNAVLHGARARRWLGTQAQVIYSGVDEAFLGGGGQAAGVPLPSKTPADAKDRFVLNLVGSLYFEDRLADLLQGIAAWSRTLTASERQQVVLRYVGGDVGMFERLIELAGLEVACQADGYVPVPSMAVSCREAAVNMYIAHEGSFHHKLLELLASGRPVMCYPQEGSEAHMLAAGLQGELIEPLDREGTMQALRALHHRWRDGADRPAPPLELYQQYSWDSQANLLEGVLINATRT